MFQTTIRVSVAGAVREYPVAIAEFGEYIADGGRVIGLTTALEQARKFFRTAGAEWTALTFWVVLDDSGLAYRVDINRRGTHVITGAAPMPGEGNVREVYVA
jgi:hypothetical protein